MTHVIIENVNKNYGDQRVIHDVNLQIEKGEIVALLGRNGMGKSTTINSICGMVHKYEGNINFNNYYAYNSGWLTSWIYNVNLPIVDFGNRWVHLVYTYEESTVDSYGDYPGGYPSNLIKFYVDGAFVAEDYSQRGVGTTSSYGTGPLRLGGSYNSSHSSANVDLSSLRLYDKTLSATEIADNFNNTKSRFGL